MFIPDLSMMRATPMGIKDPCIFRIDDKRMGIAAERVLEDGSPYFQMSKEDIMTEQVYITICIR